MKATCYLTLFIEVSRTDMSTDTENRVQGCPGGGETQKQGLVCFESKDQVELERGDRHGLPLAG